MGTHSNDLNIALVVFKEISADYRAILTSFNQSQTFFEKCKYSIEKPTRVFESLGGILIILDDINEYQPSHKSYNKSYSV